MGLCSRGASCWRPTIITCCGGVCLCVWCGVLVHQDDDEHVHIEDETKGKAQSFHANQAFDGGCSQQQMFESCGITGLIDAAIEGFPVCCFAYGQTGSGKTHTIIGEESFITRKNYSGSDVDGLIPRAGKYLFERAAAMKDRTFRIRASFLEIYNEQACCCACRCVGHPVLTALLLLVVVVVVVVVGQVYDLLNFNTKQPKVLQVRHSPKVGFFVDDLSEVTIDSPQDLCVGCKSLLLVVLFPCAHAM